MAPPANESTSTTHYNDWPNTQGFDVRYQELEPTELPIQGTIPPYCVGVLFRNGLGPRDIQTENQTIYRVSHWFDCFAQVHRFQIHAPTPEQPRVRVTHNSRLTCDGLVRRIQRTGYRGEITLGAKYDPCMSLFQKAQSVFKTIPRGLLDEVDISVTLNVNFPGLSVTGSKQEGMPGPGIQTLCNRTDNSTFQMLDPQTLEPIGIADQTVLHPSLRGPLSAAHCKTDLITGDVYNYNLDIGLTSTYRVFHVSHSTGKTSILATFKHAATYVHSLFLTENYVVLCLWNARFRAGGMSLLWTHNFVDALADYDPTQRSTWFVVDRTPGGRGLIARYESDPFFSFHTINAYEEPSSSDPSKTDIIADVCAYGSLDVLKRFYIDNLLSDSATAHHYGESRNHKARGAFRRFRLPAVPEVSNHKTLTAEIVFSMEKGLGSELPQISPRVRGCKYRYVYGVTDSGKSVFLDGLVKHDVVTQTSLYWSQHGQTASEPIFVADPDSEDEDGGVLLSVVLNGIEGNSYLLVLEAKTMTEVGRAIVNGVVGFGFHGAHVRDN
ncbi:carotenoid oxygenase [Aspergillus caelatus]|uniref:Carotenoid oxygenase n=1 Tax=Aspergillus caelatus TaxID=61420 RepID=A0A5N6ZPG8_9EURO|nr:carotenoid oxygenase [Aspergillus caelatus]KAE8359517.1 carotenoid oxygenase [Aspergillus caelatus]